jgi:hypothetical protein
MAEKKEKGGDKDIQALYAEVQKTYKLPDFSALNADFDIDTIDPMSKHLVKELTKKMFERVELFKKILETTLQPDVSILNMQESEFLAENDHEIVADILRRLMKLDRTLLIAELENSDELYAEFIIEAAKEWPKVKKELAPVIKHMQLGWSTRHKIKQFQHYLG